VPHHRSSQTGRAAAPAVVGGAREGWVRIFFATDIHGSEVCWRKFLNAGAFHKADVLVMGGDMTGKAMIPITARNGSWEVTLQEQRHVMATDEELRAMEKRISDRGYYPVRTTPDELEAWSRDQAMVDERFKAEMLGGVQRWMDLADERLAGKSIRCIVSPANDDMFEIDPIIAAAGIVELGEANTIALDGFSLVSTGWANPTPWNTFRELPEDQLRERIDGLVRDVPDPKRAIFNFHAPPYGSNLDNAPKLDADMNYVAGGQALVPVGSRAVRDSIVAYGPVASLHGHIHEGKGAVKIGRTLAVNPGSSYEDGTLQAAIVDLDARKGEVKSYLLITG
jgi:Icc-related predicted phosphoesterase